MRSKLLIVLTATALIGSVQAAERPTKGLRYASLTPDLKRVVFCYRGDVWVTDVDGKSRATRLTIHEAQDTLARVSPDGKLVAFSSRREGNYDIYVMPIEGGLPRRITFHSGWEAVCDWSPDGKRILFISAQAGDPGRTDVFEVSLDGGTPRRITFDGGRDASYSKDGKWITYSRGFNTIYWDNYTGSANYDLYVLPAAGGTPRRLTHTDGNERYSFFSADGKTIYFVAEENGVANFYSMPLEGGKRTQITKYKGSDVHRPDLAWDHKTVVFERVGQLYVTDLSDPKATTRPIRISIQSDERNSGIETRTITSGGEQVHLSADGREAAFSLRGDIWIMPAAGGKGRRVTSGPTKDEWPRFSPDGKSIAFISNRRGNSDLYLLDLETEQVRPLTSHPANDFYHNWSPDGRKLVYCSERSGNRDIWVLDIESGQNTQLTRSKAGDDDPTFSPDGKRIAFDSARDGSQAIYVMNADGSNPHRVTQGTGFFQVPSFSPDGTMIVYEVFSPTTGRSGGLFVVNATGGPSMQITRDGATACWRGDYIYFHSDRGPHGDGIWRVKAPASVEAGERVPFIGTVDVELKKELANLFDEAWTALRDAFYDPKMHKVNWNDMRKKYRDMAIDAENKDEFQNVVRQMLAELGASHLGIVGGQKLGASVTPKFPPTGYLGLEFAQKPEKDGARRVTRVLRGGPADRAGVRVGDLVTRIGRTKLAPKTNLDKVLNGTVGKTIPVTFKPRADGGWGLERTAPVEPIDFMPMRQLKYKEWLAQSLRRVKDASKGAVAYLHLSQMDGQNLMRFQQSVANWNRNKKIKGMILDVRDNGGGNIHNQLMSVLWAKPLARVQMRGRPEMIQPSLYWDKPVVLLINERSFSDAEVFPHMFKTAGIGKVIGVPTAGGVIGTNNITLSDGSSFRLPRTGFKTMDGKNLEGFGVKPDILVEETPEDRLNGRDPQLAKALEVILDQIQAKKKTAPKPKKKPVKPVEKTKPAPKPEVPVTAKGEVEPLLDAAPGEWVRYSLRGMGEGEDTVFKVSVSKVENNTVAFTKEIEKGGGMQLPPLPDQLQKMKLLTALEAFGKVGSHAVVDGKIGDKPTRLLLVDVAWPDGSQIKLTFTNAVPCYGLLRVEMDKMVLMQAVAWGEAPRAETPVESAPEEQPEAKEGKRDIPVHPLYDAKQGEWVKIRRFGSGGQEIEMIIEVAEVTDEEVVLKQKLLLQGREIPGPTIRRPRKKELTPPGDIEAKSYGTEEVTIGDHTLKCITMTAEDPNGDELKWIVCPDVPVNGLVRLLRNGEVQIEVVEWGTSDG